MLIWRGWGFVTPLLIVLPFVGCFSIGMILGVVLPDRVSLLAPLFAVPLGMVVAGVTCWKVGSLLNQGRPNEMAHTAWFVRIEHWGIVALVFAVPIAAFCLLIAGFIIQFCGRDKPGDALAAVDGDVENVAGPIEKPTPPFAMARPEPQPVPLPDFELEDYSAFELAMAARQSIEQEKPGLAAIFQRLAVEKGSDQFYNLACYESLAGRIDESIYWLQEAGLKEGVSIDWSQEDSDLENLRDDPRWNRVLAFLKQCGRYWAASGTDDHQLVLPANYDGEPIPVMVWLHGMGDRAESYVFEELQEIADTNRVAFVSVSGTVVNGPTSFSWAGSMPKNEQRIDAALAKFADQLKPKEGQIALGGFSQGGQVAGELAAKRPERYSGALIMSPGGFDFSLDDLDPNERHKQQTIIAVCGAGEHPGNVRLTGKYADWFREAGGT
jgi:predicted esterase